MNFLEHENQVSSLAITGFVPSFSSSGGLLGFNWFY